MAEKQGRQEYDKDSSLGKIESMIMHVVMVIDKIKDRQTNRIMNERCTRGCGNELYGDDRTMDKFCIAMDNYFTLPKVIKALRDKNIGIVGTARFKKSGLLRR